MLVHQKLAAMKGGLGFLTIHGRVHKQILRKKSCSKSPSFGLDRASRLFVNHCDLPNVASADDKLAMAASYPESGEFKVRSRCHVYATSVNRRSSDPGSVFHRTLQPHERLEGVHMHAHSPQTTQSFPLQAANLTPRTSQSSVQH